MNKKSFFASIGQIFKYSYVVLTAFLLAACSGGGESGGGSTNNGGGGSVEEVNEAATADFPTFYKANFSTTDKEQMFANINAMIDPSIGAYLIYKPGALPIPQKFTSADELQQAFGTIGESLILLGCEPAAGDLPYYDCDSFDKEGCFFKETNNGTALNNCIQMVEDSYLREFSDAEKAGASKADQAVSTVMVSTKAYVEMSFGKVDGKWKLITINIAAFDCGA